MRGEDPEKREHCIPKLETPPHAWGRRRRLCSWCRHRGNTPTCVGKTSRPVRSRYGVGKHPHMRGEDDGGAAMSTALIETPPHAWGRLLPSVAVKECVGNTPTCVGKTHAMLIWMACSVETPPHAWGRPVRGQLKCVAERNTPTCVGKTSPCSSSTFAAKKHPHMRGEDPERSLNFFLHTWY